MKYLSIILILLIHSSLFGQSISGTVVDAQELPIEWASISIENAQDSSFVTGTITDSVGFFKLDQIGATDILLTISYIGHAQHTQQITIGNNTDLGVIRLDPVAQNLTEVVVKSTRPLIQYKNGKLTYDISAANVLAVSAIDLMNMVPLVHLDKDENILLRGNIVKVLINGQDLHLAGEELKNYLRSLNSDEISKVEVITNPSAKYEAEGPGGILNIVLKERKRGIYSSALVFGGYGKYYKAGGGASVTYFNGKLGVSGSIYPSKSKSQNYLTIDRINRFNNTEFSQRNLWLPESTYLPMNASLNYQFNDKHSVSTFFKKTYSNSNERSENSTDITGSINNSQLLLQEGFKNWDRNTYGINYEWNLDTTDKVLSAEWLGVTATNDQASDQSININNERQFALNQSTDYNFKINSFKLDYEQSLAKGYFLETGIKYSDINSMTKLAYRFDEGSKDNINYDLEDNDFTYNENIFAIYGTVSKEWGAISIEAGLRIESTVVHTILNKPELYLETKSPYTSLFPNFSISYELPKNSSLSFAYSRRLDRPYYRSLNPAIEFMDQYSFSVGNIGLEPEYYHNFELDYQKGQAVVSAYLTKTTGTIDDIVLQIDSSNVLISTEQNLSETFSGGLSCNYSKDFGKLQTNFDLFVGYDQAIYRTDDIDYKQDIVNGGIRVNMMMPFGEHFKANLNGSYRTASQYGLSKSAANYAIGTSLAFVRNNFTIQLRVTDIFNTSRWDATTKYNNVDIHWVNRWESRKATLSLKLNFGNTKLKRKGSYKKSTYSDEGSRIGS